MALTSVVKEQSLAAGSSVYQQKDSKIIEYAKDCPYWINYHGLTKHMSIREFPRLILEVIRGTYRYRKLKALWPASERMNSAAKDDFLYPCKA
jgi:hypothetical protein